jgi:hypothetical protein
LPKDLYRVKVDFYRHSLLPRHAEAVAAVLATPFLTTGKVAQAVEAQLAEYFSLPYALLVNSWTNGALAALLALDIGPGDEVIVPAMTFIASANVVELVGAKVVFADVDPSTLLLTPELAAKRVTRQTRAVIPVHLYGQMCDIPALRKMLESHPARSQRVCLIEDCAHCFEGERDGTKPGAHSDVAIFSFYATKNITCGEGGAIVTGDQFYWRVDSNTLIGHQLPIALIGLRAERHVTSVNTFWDWGMVYEFCPSRHITAIADSDEFLMLELRPEMRSIEAIRLGRTTPREIARRTTGYITEYQVDSAKFQLLLHSENLPKHIDVAQHNLRRFVGAVLRDLPTNPLDHRKHAQWLYHRKHFRKANLRCQEVCSASGKGQLRNVSRRLLIHTKPVAML